MNLKAYRVIEPKLDDPFRLELLRIAKKWPNRLARLFDAIDAFMGHGDDPAYRVAPSEPHLRRQPDPSLPEEIYLVPRILVSGACALMHVDHVTRTVTYIAVYPTYGDGGEDDQLHEILRRAASSLRSVNRKDPP